MKITPAASARLTAYEARTNPYLVGLALSFVVIYGVPVIWPDLPHAAAMFFSVANFLVWAAFVVDLGIRSWLSGRPVHYLLRHPIDILLVVLPMLRVLRVLRIFTAANYLVNRAGGFAVGRTIVAAVTATMFLLIVAALAILDAERVSPDANITNFGDALWWAGTTVTTVGYGDRYPVTGVGRMVAFALMLVGISMLGVITASVAAWFVARTRKAEDEVLTELRRQREDIAELRELLLAATHRPAGTPT